MYRDSYKTTTERVRISLFPILLGCTLGTYFTQSLTARCNLLYESVNPQKKTEVFLRKTLPQILDKPQIRQDSGKNRTLLTPAKDVQFRHKDISLRCNKSVDQSIQKRFCP